jgi:pimeloyl-ACP methyl ester carboxylesterase
MDIRTPARRDSRRSVLSFTLAASTLAGVLSASSPAHADPEYRIIDSTTESMGQGLTRTVTTVQVGDDPIDRFRMHRLTNPGNPASVKGTIFLLPPISIGFEHYEIGDRGEFHRSFAAFFAKHGYDVWGYSQRTAELVAGSCEGGEIDCSAMEGWGLQTIVDDATFIRAQIEAAHPGERPAVGGVSLGSIAAMALIGAHPDDYAGAFMLEGSLYGANPEERQISQTFCDQLEGALSYGVYYDGTSLSSMRLVASLASDNPSGHELDGPGGLTNHQVWVSMMSTPQIGPLQPRQDYFFLAGDVAQDRFYFADDRLARANMTRFSDYLALRTVRDLSCSLAGDTTFIHDISSFQGPLFVLGGGHGFGPMMIDALSLMPEAEATTSVVQPFGHMDHYFNANHRDLMEKPLLEWLKTVFHAG